jgi:hypothetical protein
MRQPRRAVNARASCGTKDKEASERRAGETPDCLKNERICPEMLQCDSMVTKN